MLLIILKTRIGTRRVFHRSQSYTRNESVDGDVLGREDELSTTSSRDELEKFVIKVEMKKLLRQEGENYINKQYGRMHNIQHEHRFDAERDSKQRMLSQPIYDKLSGKPVPVFDSSSSAAAAVVAATSVLASPVGLGNTGASFPNISRPPPSFPASFYGRQQETDNDGYLKMSKPANSKFYVPAEQEIPHLNSVSTQAQNEVGHNYCNVSCGEIDREPEECDEEEHLYCTIE